MALTLEQQKEIDRRLIAGGDGNTRNQIARDLDVYYYLVSNRAKLLLRKGMILPKGAVVKDPNDPEQGSNGDTIAALRQDRLLSSDLDKGYVHRKVDLRLERRVLAFRAPPQRKIPTVYPMPWVTEERKMSKR